MWVGFVWAWLGSARSPETSIFPFFARVRTSNLSLAPAVAAGSRGFRTFRTSRRCWRNAKKSTRLPFVHRRSFTSRPRWRILESGRHVLLEKPPCSTTIQLDELARLAARKDRTLFQSWHSRFAPAVDAAREALQGRRIRKVTIIWKEDVRRWHPGQRWIWEAGGFGIFDPGINAISILTKVLPDPLFVTAAELFIPENCQAPIAANVRLQSHAGMEVAAAFDFRHTGDQTWDIRVETDSGSVDLTEGGSRLSVDGRNVDQGATPPHPEYAPLYRHFANLITSRRSDVDGTPFRLVADAFLIGSRVTAEPFHD